MSRLSPKILPIGSIAAQLNAGRPIMLIPVFVPLQPPDPALGVVPVVRVHPLQSPGLLRVDLSGDTGVLLVHAEKIGL